MGFFSFGGSKSSSQSSGFSQSTDESQSGGFSVGSSVQGSQQTSVDSIAFEDVFAKLFGGASGAAAGLDPSLLTEQANTLFSGGLGFLEQLGGGAGSAYMEQRLSGENPVLQEQIDLLGEDLGKFYEEQLLPGISAEAVGGGQLGGGRQGVAQGAAAQGVAGEFRRGASALRSADIAQRDQVAGMLESLGIDAAGTGLAAMPGLAGIAELGFGADMLPYMMLAQITGDPTVLNQSQGTSYGSSQDFAANYSQSYGQSTSETQSSSSSKDIKFGFGGK